MSLTTVKLTSADATRSSLTWLTRQGLYAVLGAALILAGPVPAADDPNAPLSSNLNGINDFSDEFPFVDLMKSSRDWIPGNASGCFDCREPGSNAACLAPNACPVSVNRDSNGFVSSLQPNQVVRTVIHAGTTPGRLAAGNYTMRFDGQGTIQMFGASVVNQSSGQLVFNIASSSGNNIGFNLTTVNAGDPLRNLRILPPGGVCANDERRFCDTGNPCASAAVCNLFTTAGVAEQQIFQPRFLTNVAGYRMLRFMDWMETNSSPVVSFADYPTPTSAFWHRVPPQILAELGNRIASDLWINIPHRADNGFIDAFATVLRDDFRSDRRIYIEYSNENWNGIFAQGREIGGQFCPGFADLAANCQQDGVPGNGIACEIDPNTFNIPEPGRSACFQALVRAWGDRSVQIFDRFDSVFGASAGDRLVRVIAAQAANPDLGRQIMARNVTGQAFTVASRTDAYASAPYFGTEYCTPDNGFNPDSDPAIYASTSAFLDHLQTQGLDRARGFMQGSRAMLDNNFGGLGIRHISYEGGQHLVGVGGFTFNSTCNTRFDEANNDPRMGTIYQTYLGDWKLNGDEFTHFVNVGRWGPFGRWGALEFQDQSPSASPKFSAMQAFSAANPCWWPGCTQSGGSAPDPLFSDGFEGAATPSCTPAQLLGDSGLEQTAPDGQSNPVWASTSSNFGTVFCSTGICPDDGSAPAPRTGTFYAWFGGFNGAESSSLSQTVSIPAGNPRHLNFFLRSARSTAPLDAELRVLIDGNTVRTFAEPAATEPSYVARTVDLSAFANGAAHQLRFEYSTPAGGGVSNFLVDDISIDCVANGN